MLNNAWYRKALRDLQRFLDVGSISATDRARLNWNKYVLVHLCRRHREMVKNLRMGRCDACRLVTHPDAKYCERCGSELYVSQDDIGHSIRSFWEASWSVFPLLEELYEGMGDEVLPASGVYIYYHPTEGYKIGQAENVPRRLMKHECSAPSLELLHVIETSDLDWAERFVHKKFAHRKRMSNHEYFDLTLSDMVWLFSTRVLNPPRSIGDQLSLLDLI